MSTQLDAPQPTSLQTGDILWPRDPRVTSLPTSVGEIIAWGQPQGGPSVAQLAALLKRILLELRALPGLDLGQGVVATGLGAATLLDSLDWSSWSLAKPQDLLWLPDWLLWLDDLLRLYAAQLHGLAVAEGRVPDQPATELDRTFPWLREALGIDPGRATFFGFYSGHCALVDCRSGVPWVVESSYTAGGMHMLPYQLWRDHRLAIGAKVWHGRVLKEGRELTDGERTQMLTLAHRYRQQRKHYAIFDRSASGQFAQLGDPSYIYCSELVWLCGQAVGVDLDARRPPKLIFLGPRALARSPSVRMLNEPGGVAY